jgi:chromosome segregation ATPase
MLPHSVCIGSVQKIEGLQNDLAESGSKINDLLTANENFESSLKQSEEERRDLAKELESMKDLQNEAVSLLTKLNLLIIVVNHYIYSC